MAISRRQFLRDGSIALGAVTASKYLIACTSEETSAIAGIPSKGTVIRIENGIPELYIHGEKSSRMWGRLALPGDYGPEKLDMYQPAGIDAYFTSLDTAISLCWDGEDEFYFDKYEAHIRRLVEQKSDIRLVLFVGATGGSPYKWCKNHEEELTLYDTGQRIEAASIASEIWKKDSSRAFSEFVKYFSQSKYAENIIGFNPVYNANEWFSHHRKSMNEFGWADFSKPMLNRFRNWLREKYSNDVQALRESWKDKNVSFETVTIPTREERLNADDPNFFYTCTGLGNRIADYYLCYDEGLADLGIHWCKTIKESSDIPRLAGMMYAYSYCGRHDANLFPHHHGHGTAMRAVKSEWVDFMHSPYHYYNRSINGTHYSQHAPDSVINHGKIFIDQIDSKPHLRHGPNHNASTPWESEQLLKRDVSYSLTKNMYCYWLEGGPGNMFPIVRHSPERWGRLWYDDPDILANIGRLKELTDKNQKENNTSVTEMAIITSNEGLYKRKLEKVFGNLYIEAFRQWFLPETGVPFDDYIMEDIPNIEKKYKLYIFLNPHFMTTDLREKIKAKIRSEKATALWLYAPGYLDENGCNIQNIEDLTGIKMEKSDEKRFIQVRISDYRHPYTKGMERNTHFGSDISPEFFKKDIRWMPWPSEIEDYKFTPVFFSTDPDVNVLGTLEGLGKPGLVEKDMDGWKSVYCSAPLLNSRLVRNIARESGVHVYSENGDLIYANSRYVSVTAAETGKATIMLPGEFKVTDALTGEVLTTASNRIEYNTKQYETRIFELT
jgi:hypothetical protein